MDPALKNKILSYRVEDLKALLFAVEGRNAYGLKAELQKRVFRLLEEGRGAELKAEMRKLGAGLIVKRHNTRSGQQGRGQASSTNRRNTVGVSVSTAPPPPGGTRTRGSLRLIPLWLASPSTSASAFSSRPGNFVAPSPPQPGGGGGGMGGSSFMNMQDFKVVLGQEVGRASLGSPSQEDLVLAGQQVPIPPGIMMRDLPFFESQSEIIPLTKLIAWKGKQVKLEGREMRRCTVRIPQAQLNSAGTAGETDFLLRFADLTMASPDRELDDLFPPHLRVLVNDELAYFMRAYIQGVKVKISNKPINITKYVSRVGSNTLTIFWEDNGKQSYVMSMLAGSPITARKLRTRLLEKPPYPVSSTISIIEGLTSEDHQDVEGVVCAPPSVRACLTCPIGKQRMRYPCRGAGCRHLQCFDGFTFLQMNEKKLKFDCPVCGSRLKFEDLSVDEFFLRIIKDLPPQAGEEFNIFSDGRLEPVVVDQTEEIEVDCDDSPRKRLQAGDEQDDDVLILTPARKKRTASSSGMNGTRGGPEVVLLDD